VFAAFDPSAYREKMEQSSRSNRSGIAVWWGVDGGLGHAPLVYEFDTGAPGEHAVSVAELDGDPGAELVVATGDQGLFRLDFAADHTLAREALDVPFGGTQGKALEARGVDVDGDGVQDVVVGIDSATYVIRQLPCTAQREANHQCKRVRPQ
jgi:hypothetical protein